MKAQVLAQTLHSLLQLLKFVSAAVLLNWHTLLLELQLEHICVWHVVAAAAAVVAQQHSSRHSNA
jgi:hypothetical protein